MAKELGSVGRSLVVWDSVGRLPTLQDVNQFTFSNSFNLSSSSFLLLGMIIFRALNRIASNLAYLIFERLPQAGKQYSNTDMTMEVIIVCSHF
jgi:hypothetical protein